MTQPAGTQSYWPGQRPYSSTSLPSRKTQQPIAPYPPQAISFSGKEPHDKGIFALGVIKTLVGGFIVGGTVAVTKHLKILPVVGIDMVMGIGETILASWIIKSNNPIAQKLIEISSKLSKAPDKPARYMTNHEKEQALTPISAIASVISALGTLKISEALEKQHWIKTNGVTEAEAKQAKGLDKLLKWPKAKILAIHGKVHLPQSIKANGLYKKTLGTEIGKVVAAALLVGVLEGILAGHLKKHEEENERKGKKGLSGLF